MLLTWLSAYFTLRRMLEVGTAMMRFEFGVAAIMRFSVSAYSVLILRRVAIVPPIGHARPRPLVDVKDVVAEDRHALVEAGLDSGDRRAHQRDGDDADDDAERGQHGARLVRLHLRSGDLPALGQLVEEALHCGV